MANILDSQGFWTNENPASYRYTHIGTAAGTTTISNIPSVLHSIVITNRAASGVIIIYDSAGTSGTVIGTITLGTATNFDPPPTYFFDAQTKFALTIANGANIEAVVLSLP